MSKTKKQSIIEVQKAIALTKNIFADKLSKRLNLTNVSAPLFLTETSGLQDNLNGIEIPVSFVTACQTQCQVVHSLAKWKRHVIQKYDVPLHSGIYADMKAIRSTEVLDNLHSYLVDQWDWEVHIAEKERNVNTLHKYVNLIVQAMYETQDRVLKLYPHLKRVITHKNVKFITTQQLEDMYPSLTPKQRENEICKKFHTVFIMQIGKKLKSGNIHDGRSPDYDDWELNGDILIYYAPLDCAVELSSMGIRVDKHSLIKQLTERGMLERTKYDFHQSIIKKRIPFTIGGGIGQSRLCMVLLNKLHIGEVQASHWTKNSDINKEFNIL